MYFLLSGTDSHRSRKKLAQLREQFSAKRDVTGLNATVLRGKDAEWHEVAEVFYASPFLADKKLVVMEGFLQRPAGEQEKIAALLPKKPESTVVIFYEDVGTEDLAKSPLLPLLKSQKFSEEFGTLSGTQLESMVVEECRSSGVTVSPRQARVMVTTVGADTWLLHEEIAKLCAYVRGSGATAVSDEMLANVVPGAREESLFELVDACVEGRPSAGLLLERALASGTSEIQVLAMVVKQFRTLIVVLDLLQRGERDKAAIARKAGVHPFVAQKAMAAARRHSVAELRTRYDELLEIERGMKTSAAPAAALLAGWLARRALAH